MNVKPNQRAQIMPRIRPTRFLCWRQNPLVDQRKLFFSLFLWLWARGSCHVNKYEHFKGLYIRAQLVFLNRLRLFSVELNMFCGVLLCQQESGSLVTAILNIFVSTLSALPISSGTTQFCIYVREKHKAWCRSIYLAFRLTVGIYTRKIRQWNMSLS